MPRLFEDFAVGDVFHSARRTITDADVRAFAELTGDRNGIHVDDEVARAGKYGRRIAHGALVFSASIGLLQSDDDGRPEVIAFLGVDRLRFASPVFPGDTVRVRQTIRSLDVVNAEHGLLDTANEVVNQDDVVTASYVAKFLIRRSGGGSTRS